MPNVATTQLISAIINSENSRYIFTILAIGPIAGLIALIRIGKD